MHEMRLYFACALFLMFFSFALSAYRRLLMGENLLSLEQGGFGVIQSLILAKIIVIGQHFKLGDRFNQKPLVIPTFYKTVVFCLLVLVFNLAEHFVKSLLHGKSTSEAFSELVQMNWEEQALKILVMFFAFVLLFAFMETGRALGNNKLFELFFRSRKV